ncbi:MAG: hypothetical protein ABIB79_04730 [archaeon]
MEISDKVKSLAKGCLLVGVAVLSTIGITGGLSYLENRDLKDGKRISNCRVIEYVYTEESKEPIIRVYEDSNCDGELERYKETNHFKGTVTTYDFEKGQLDRSFYNEHSPSTNLERLVHPNIIREKIASRYKESINPDPFY